MGVEHSERRDGHRILSAALDDPDELSARELERSVELLESDRKRVRIGASWVFAAVAAESPNRVVTYVPQIAALLEDPEVRSAATRALAYIGRSRPEVIERELASVDEGLARQCRNALWGQFAPKKVVETAENRSRSGASMGRTDGDRWGWVGGGSTDVYDSDSGSKRRRPPTDRPIDPPSVDYEFDRYTPVTQLYRGEIGRTFKVVYWTPDGGTNVGLFKRFASSGKAFRSAFDRRVAMWQSLDDHEAILPVVDWGTEPDPWLVTAYEDTTGVEGLGRDGRADAAVWTLREVADALCFAHRHGVVHGVLTPGSIVRSSIMTEPDAWRYPRVTDWGYMSLFRSADVRSVLPERYLAPEHLSPERFGGVDGSTDIYGFGVIACEALLGQLPSELASEPESRSSSTGPTVRDDRLSNDLSAFFEKCLATRKTERFETVQTMRAAFLGATGSVDD